MFQRFFLPGNPYRGGGSAFYSYNLCFIGQIPFHFATESLEALLQPFRNEGWQDFPHVHGGQSGLIRGVGQVIGHFVCQEICQSLGRCRLRLPGNGPCFLLYGLLKFERRQFAILVEFWYILMLHGYYDP